MDEKTIQYYSLHVKESADLYNSCAGKGISKYFPTAFFPGSRILDIGIGTGRDLKILHSTGYDAYGIDATYEMVRYAIDQDKSLADRIKVSSIPSDQRFFNDLFDGILCSAILMHIPDEHLFDSVFTIRNNIITGGRLLVSVPVERDDVGPESRTPDGRLFIIRPSAYYILLFERIGFTKISYFEEDDSLGRRGIRWAVMIFELHSLQGRPIDKIESILNRDKKVATYKLALFRALCDIALTEFNSVTWYQDDRVGIDVKNVADKWMLYYWPLVENPVFIPQLNGEKESDSKSILFRSSLKELVSSYKTQGGLNRFYMDLAEKRDFAKQNRIYSEVLKKVITAIVKGPVIYSGGSLDERTLFEYNSKDKKIVFSADIWRELSLMGYWINDALILRWGELTSDISGGEIQASRVIDLLLRLPITERDTQASRGVFSESASLECVWTGVSLKDKFDIDHVIPFSLWHNNDLWNLLPSHPKVNNHKRDKLPARDLLNSRRDVIIEYWRIIQEKFPSRFKNEFQKITGSICNDNWQLSLFSTVSEAVEITALQRGIERWGG